MQEGDAIALTIQEGNTVKVTAHLDVEKNEFIFDVPVDKCNREDFIPYLKQLLLDSTDLKVEFEIEAKTK